MNKKLELLSLANRRLVTFLCGLEEVNSTNK